MNLTAARNYICSSQIWNDRILLTVTFAKRMDFLKHRHSLSPFSVNTMSWMKSISDWKEYRLLTSSRQSAHVLAACLFILSQRFLILSTGRHSSHSRNDAVASRKNISLAFGRNVQFYFKTTDLKNMYHSQEDNREHG